MPACKAVAGRDRDGRQTHPLRVARLSERERKSCRHGRTTLHCTPPGISNATVQHHHTSRRCIIQDRRTPRPVATLKSGASRSCTSYPRRTTATHPRQCQAVALLRDSPVIPGTASAIEARSSTAERANPLIRLPTPPLRIRLIKTSAAQRAPGTACDTPRATATAPRPCAAHSSSAWGSSRRASCGRP